MHTDSHTQITKRTHFAQWPQKKVLTPNFEYIIPLTNGFTAKCLLSILEIIARHASLAKYVSNTCTECLFTRCNSLTLVSLPLIHFFGVALFFSISHLKFMKLIKLRESKWMQKVYPASVLIAFSAEIYLNVNKKYHRSFIRSYIRTDLFIA